LVFCDLETLRTLLPREFRSGMAEVIKYGAVCSAPLFVQLEEGKLEKAFESDHDVLQDIVVQCVRLKAEVVCRDELDKRGIRNVLNFGHTFGHALELSAHGLLTHGEAISIGMVAAARLAVALGVASRRFSSG
jgi:3-dehydroquinate synthase